MERRLRRRDVSAQEVLDAHLLQIERVNPKVNAIVTLTVEKARLQAKRADEAAAKGQFLGPLHGLPVAHKDLEDTQGIRTTYGSPIYRDHVPEHNSLLVERVWRAGAVLVGKTNTPEFGAGAQTFNTVFGATRNPYDLTKTCGGSSGGAAVSVACRMAALADGSDLGGSLRIPASFCSVVGLRPSPGRVPYVPAISAWNTLSVLGPMARTVEDAALLLSAIAAPDGRAPLSIHEAGSNFARPLGRDFKGVRVAWCSQFGGLPFEPSVRELFAARRKSFELLGCAVEEAAPDFSDADEVFKVLRALSFHQQYAPLVEKHRDQIKQTVIEEVERGARLGGPEIGRAETLRSRLFVRLAEFLERYEFFVLPTAQALPFPIEQPYVAEVDGVRMGSYIDWFRSCYYISVTGLPAISAPAGFTEEGLPIGLQIVGRHQDDWGVLQLAHAFEQAAGLRDSCPKVALAV